MRLRTHSPNGSRLSRVERFAAFGILLAVEVFIRLQPRIVCIAELSRLLVGDGISGFGARAGVLISI
jgi:hypothetical protein